MMPDVATLNYVLAIGTILLQVATLALLGIYFFGRGNETLRAIGASVGRFGYHSGFAFALGGALLTLYYSDVLGFEPCPLCWWQRIFLYPQVLLFALAAWRKEMNIAVYSIALSVCGLAVALYQHGLQMLPSGTLPCPATSVSCAQRIVFEFGYITFPLMAASLFAFLIVVMLFVKRK